MLQIVREAINPMLKQHDCPEINIRIGVDIGETTVIQSGWDIHSNTSSRQKNNMNTIITTTNHNKKQQDHHPLPLERKPVYDVLSYTLSIAVKMTALANHNRIVIGDPMYSRLDYKQRSAFQSVSITPDIWDYVCKNSEGNIYNLYTDVV